MVSGDCVANSSCRTAELTTGVLCVSCPEIGTLFRKRERGLPTPSIVNGDYRRDPTNRKWTSRGTSKLNHENRKMDRESYLELNEGRMYDVQATRDSSHAEQHVPGEVFVTQEYRIDSRVV